MNDTVEAYAYVRARARGGDSINAPKETDDQRRTKM